MSRFYESFISTNTRESVTMRWAARQRQEFIRERLMVVGHINRSNIRSEFDVSIQQASHDLKEFDRANPGCITYNKRAKRYEGTPTGTFHCPICMGDEPHTHQMTGRWIGVDFDGTLAHDRDGRDDPYELGEPIPAMVQRVQGWIAAGYRVVVFTARLAPYSFTAGRHRDVQKMGTLIYRWTIKHIGEGLGVTNTKDGAMEVLWDDRAVRVIKGTGTPAELYRPIPSPTPNPTACGES